MEKLIALRDINDTIKTGDRFDAPDRIFVALGLAALDVPEQPPVEEDTPQRIQPRRRRGRQSS